MKKSGNLFQFSTIEVIYESRSILNILLKHILYIRRDYGYMARRVKDIIRIAERKLGYELRQYNVFGTSFGGCIAQSMTRFDCLAKKMREVNLIAPLLLDVPLEKKYDRLSTIILFSNQENIAIPYRELFASKGSSNYNSSIQKEITKYSLLDMECYAFNVSDVLHIELCTAVWSSQVLIDRIRQLGHLLYEEIKLIQTYK
jgi:hypothetical protein